MSEEAMPYTQTSVKQDSRTSTTYHSSEDGRVAKRKMNKVYPNLDPLPILRWNADVLRMGE